MEYILKKDNYYCSIDEKNTIRKTQNINIAYRFSSIEKAQNWLNKATKKLKGYKIYDIENEEIIEEIVKVKRKKFSSKERAKIYNKNKGKCAICGRFVSYDDFTIDHIIPLSRGGENKLTNLQCTCYVCNQIKHDILPEDFMDKLSEIILYQMKKNFNENFYRKISYLRKCNRKNRIAEAIKIFIGNR